MPAEPTPSTTTMSTIVVMTRTSATPCGNDGEWRFFRFAESVSLFNLLSHAEFGLVARSRPRGRQYRDYRGSGTVLNFPTIVRYPFALFERSSGGSLMDSVDSAASMLHNSARS